MQESRRHFLRLAGAAAALATGSNIARAQAYPTRPVRIVLGFGPGSGSDIIARLTAQWLSERLGQSFVVENRPGAGNNIATEQVVRAPPDGYTLLQVTLANAINATLYEKLNFNFLRDITPVAGIIRVPFVFVVHPSVPAKTVPEFIAYAKANPGKMSYVAGGGNGSGLQLTAELFKVMTDTDMRGVPYRQPAAHMADLLAGRVQVVFDLLPSQIENIKANKLRALAVTTAVRQAVLPDIPTVGEFVPGYEASTLSGMGAPTGTPASVVDKLNGAVNEMLADSKARQRLVELGGTPIPGTPAEFGKVMADETEKWGNVIRAANIKLE